MAQNGELGGENICHILIVAKFIDPKLSESWSDRIIGIFWEDNLHVLHQSLQRKTRKESAAPSAVRCCTAINPNHKSILSAVASIDGAVGRVSWHSAVPEHLRGERFRWRDNFWGYWWG